MSKPLRELVEELTFYCTGDESYELFQAACSFCYKLTGLNESAKAKIVYKWAKEMAEDSKKWALENRPDEMKDDNAHGEWGN